MVLTLTKYINSGSDTDVSEHEVAVISFPFHLLPLWPEVCARKLRCLTLNDLSGTVLALPCLLPFLVARSLCSEL